VHVEVTSRCNFACEFCPNPVLQRRHGSMEWPMLQEILGEIAAAKVTGNVVFHQQGEPLLYPHLHEGVAAATRLGLASFVTSNGALLSDAVVDRLLESGLTELNVSLQTPDEASFAIRGAHGLDYAAFEARVVNAVQRVLRAPSATRVRVELLTKPLPRLTLPNVGKDWKIVERNHELHAMLEKWAHRWVGDLEDAPSPKSITRAVRRTGVLHRNELRLHPRLVIETRPVGEWSMPEMTGDRKWHDARWGTCHGISEHIAILWDGSYTFCCADHNGRTSTASFRELSILDYLDSGPVQEALSSLQRMRPSHPYCRACLGGPHPVMPVVKAIGSIFFFKVLKKLRRVSRAS